MDRYSQELLSAPWFERLYLPTYTVREAARYAQTRVSTVSGWFNQGHSLGPALPGKTKGQSLSYLQLIEVAFVATFRAAGVSLQRIRKAREFLSCHFNTDYPFASGKFYTEGRHILFNLQEETFDPEIDRLVMADQSGQICWKPVIGARFDQVEYHGNLAIRWRPMNRASDVIIDPRLAFGAPSVKGIATWALRGRFEAGEDIDEVADDFGLTLDEVVSALKFEGVLAKS